MRQNVTLTLSELELAGIATVARALQVDTDELISAWVREQLDRHELQRLDRQGRPTHHAYEKSLTALQQEAAHA